MHHWHKRKLSEDWFQTIDPCGGITVAVDDAAGVAGIAVCSNKDQYSRKVGRLAAEARIALCGEYPRKYGVIAVPPLKENHPARQGLAEAISDATRILMKSWDEILIVKVKVNHGQAERA